MRIGMGIGGDVLGVCDDAGAGVQRTWYLLARFGGR
jgi:hypothetical protein